MVKGFLNLISSLKLTVVCLSLAMVLVFVGTLAQVKLGLYDAQEDFFRSFLVYWHPQGVTWKIPVLPGGWLLGSVLLINLIAAHLKRFRWSRKKIGIFLVHGGLILLLLGQFLTELFQVESNLRLAEGETKTYSESNRENELAIIDVSDPTKDQVISIPDSLLEKKGEIADPKIPFRIRVKKYFANSWFTGPRAGESGEKLQSRSGVGARLSFVEIPTTAAMDDENKPSALIEVSSNEGVLGEWIVSTWLTKPFWSGKLREELPDAAAILNEPQSFRYQNREYQLALRPIRYYTDYAIGLIDFSHDLYKGTVKAKNFSSRIHLTNPRTAEDRDILIYMNNPLRYAGVTYYQGSFEAGDKVSILHVVRNPAWLTPYLSCTLVGAGLLVQFLSHLVAFARRPAPVQKSAGSPRKIRRELEPEPAGAAPANRRRNR